MLLNHAERLNTSPFLKQWKLSMPIVDANRVPQIYPAPLEPNTFVEVCATTRKEISMDGYYYNAMSPQSFSRQSLPSVSEVCERRQATRRFDCQNRRYTSN